MISAQEIVLRLVAAALLGAVVGLERERLEWAAGLRTHMLVSLGSALVMIVSAYGFNDVIDAYRVVLDPSRIAAQVVSGIGFLGAGTILFLHRHVVRGLTTAASLWTVAAVGLAAGSGLYLAAITATVLVVVILAIVKPLEGLLFRRNASRLTVIIDRRVTSLAQVETEIEAAGLRIKRVKLKDSPRAEDDCADFALFGAVSRKTLLAVAAKVRDIDGVQEVSF